jgi:aquaporin Z
VFALGHISGAQLNPAVTLAVVVRGRETIMDGLYKVVAQIAGAFVGGLIAMPILDDAVSGSKISSPAVADGVSAMTAISAEAVWTMVLALVVLLTATTRSQEGNSHFGLAIGAALTAGAKAIGGISGGALNPAIGIALPVLKDDGMGDIYIYVIGPLVGGLLAAGAFYLLEKPSELR